MRKDKQIFNVFETVANEILSKEDAILATNFFHCAPWNEGSLFNTFDNLIFMEKGNKIETPNTSLKNINKCIVFFERYIDEESNNLLCIKVLQKIGTNSNELCVVSMSGGLDSSTLLAKALSEGKTCLPINYNYGQVNVVEMKAQQNIWKHFKEKYNSQLLDTIIINFTNILGDVLKTFRENVENGHAEESTGMQYYMPSRNLLFMSMAAVVGEIIANDKNIKNISLGLGIHQHSDIYAKDYWDISPEFATKLWELLSLNDNVDCSIYAPYKDGLKSEIIKDAIKLEVPYKLTWTCYDPKNMTNEKTFVPCLVCEACLERESQAKGICDDINDYTLTIL